MVFSLALPRRNLRIPEGSRSYHVLFWVGSSDNLQVRKRVLFMIPCWCVLIKHYSGGGVLSICKGRLRHSFICS
jgi:hypothetical protein